MSRTAQQWRRKLVASLTGVLIVLGLVVFAPSASAAPGTASRTGLCWYRSWFGGKHYCPADVAGVEGTRYGLGRRVWLNEANVVAVDADSVELAWPHGCAPQDWVGCQDFDFLSVPWEGSHRPRAGILVRLYGTTTKGSLIPAGYVRTGDCFYVWICAD